MKILFVLLLVLFGLFGYAFADFHERLILLLPSENDLLDSSGWKIGEIKTLKEIQTPYSDEHPNVLIRQYVMANATGQSSIRVTMNVYEFSSIETANFTNIKYVSQLMSNNFKQIPVNTIGDADCYAFIYHEMLNDEKSTISCNASTFLITATTEQSNGNVFLNGNRLPTSAVAEGFTKFALNKISIMSKYIIPYWIKNNASWWSQDKISDDDFAMGLEYMINHGIINVSNQNLLEKSETKIPSWVKNNAEWWAQNKLSDSEFLKSIQYLVNTGIIKINLKS